MKKCIKCGSLAFNLQSEGIDQGDLCDVHYWQERAHRAEALAEQPAQQEPVAAECNFVGTKEWGRCSIEHHNLVQSEPHNWPGYQTRLLYTSPQPPQRKPLTLGQKQRLWSSVGDKPTLKDRVNAYGLAIEAAHGIKELKCCDICGRKDAPYLVDLLSSHQTSEIKEVCNTCEKVLNKHKAKLQGVTANLLLDWFKKFMEQRKADHSIKENT